MDPVYIVTTLQNMLRVSRLFKRSPVVMCVCVRARMRACCLLYTSTFFICTITRSQTLLTKYNYKLYEIF